MNTYDMGGLQLSISDCFFNKTSEETALTNISELGKFIALDSEPNSVTAK